MLLALDRERALEAIAKSGVSSPHLSQTLALTRAFKRFVRGFLLECYATEAALAADEELRAFVTAALLGLTGALPAAAGGVVAAAAAGGDFDDTDFAELVCCLLTSFCERVTAGHEQVGVLAPYAADPAFCAWRWSPGELCASKRSALSEGILASMTSINMPPLLGAPGSPNDWSGALASEPGAPLPAALVELYATLQAELEELARRCDAHNAAAASRPFPLGWPIWTSHPALLEVSVSL